MSEGEGMGHLLEREFYSEQKNVRRLLEIY